MPTSVEARSRCLGLALGCALAAAPPEVRGADAVRGHLAATTDYVFRGVSQTGGAAAVQADLHYESASGWLLGAWGSTVDLDPRAGATLELNAYAGRSWAVGMAWSARVMAVHYEYPNDTPGRRYDYDELIASLSFRDRLSASLAWSPNTAYYSSYGTRWEGRALTYDLVGRWPLAGPLFVAGGAGYRDLEDVYGTGYGYWSLGLAFALRRVQFELGHYSAADRATDLFGRETTGERWALTATWQFPATH